MVFYVPDGVSRFFQVRSASNFQLLPAPARKIVTNVPEDLEWMLPGVAMSNALTSVEPLCLQVSGHDSFNLTLFITTTILTVAWHTLFPLYKETEPWSSNLKAGIQMSNYQST